MSDAQDHDRNLEARLEEAARWCEPRHPGWQTLLARLGPQEKVSASPQPKEAGLPRPDAGRSTVRRLLGLAAGLLFMASLAGLMVWLLRTVPTPQAVAADLEVEVQRRGIELTVFSAAENQEPTLYMPLARAGEGTEGDYAGQAPMAQQRVISSAAGGRGLRNAGPRNQGMGLVKDQRMVLHLKKGDNLVKFDDVAASIDPTSVRLVSETDPIGTKVIEQNLEYDLASGDALLKRSVQRRVACIGRDEQPAAEGFLIGYDADTLLLADAVPDPDPNSKTPRPKTQSIARRNLKAIRLDEVPKDLYTRPTLVWKLRTETPGDHLTTLSYLCGKVVWQADYVATITSAGAEGNDTLDLTGWVTIDNRSGTTYEQAGLKLIAGDVNRAPDPWAVIAWDRELSVYGAVGGTYLGSGLRSKELVSKDFFEYKLYALNQPSTIKDRQIKQLGLLQAGGVKAQRRFLYDSQEVDRRFSPVVLRPRAGRLTTELVVKNDKPNGLGRPLPKGRVTFVAVDADGESQFLGRDQIDHTPKDETLVLKLGEAFDVAGEFRIVTNEVPHARRFIQTDEIRIRNHKDVPINVRAIAHLRGHANWQVTKTTDDYIKHDFETLYFDFRMKANSEKTITYTVDYQW